MQPHLGGRRKQSGKITTIMWLIDFWKLDKMDKQMREMRKSEIDEIKAKYQQFKSMMQTKNIVNMMLHWYDVWLHFIIVNNFLSAGNLVQDHLSVENTVTLSGIPDYRENNGCSEHNLFIWSQHKNYELHWCFHFMGNWFSISFLYQEVTPQLNMFWCYVVLSSICNIQILVALNYSPKLTSN